MITLALVLVTIVALYIYGTRNHKYWEIKGVQHDKPVPLFGNNARNYFGMVSMADLLVEMYWKYPTEKVVGFYRASRPELVIRDPEIAKKILGKDFLHFYSRGIFNYNATVEPLRKHLFFADGDTWRLLRQRLTPAFTSGKLKAMFPLIVERTERLQSRLQAAAASSRVMDSRDLMARYTTDFIGACGFGLDADSLQDENSPFRKLGTKIFSLGLKQIISIALKDVFPYLFKHIKTFARIEKEVFNLVNAVKKQRNYEPSGRNDFIDLLLECQKKGKIEGDSIERIKPDGTPDKASLEMDDELFAAQVFVFFAAGFETSSSATSFTLHELAHNLPVQVKVQDEIDRVLAKHNNKLSYDAINEMIYLQWTLKEGMRMFPSLGFLIRVCSRKYTFEELGFTIDEGVLITIPIQAMQNDPKYFDNPTEFRPERFSQENFDIKNKHVYMPFGDGPRACIGERMGLMQSVAGLAAVLSRYSVRPAPGAPRHPPVDPYSGIVQTVKGGLPLLFVERTLKQVID